MKFKPLTDFEKAQRQKAQAILSAAAKALTVDYGVCVFARQAKPFTVTLKDPQAPEGVGVFVLTLDTVGVLTVKKDGQILARSLPIAPGNWPQLDTTCKLPRWLV
jgi:hypothetical protein